MAQKTLVQLVDDLDGSLIAEGEGRTVTVGWDGATYELDLSTEHVEELTTLLEPYVVAGRKVGRKTTTVDTGTKSDPAELKKIREWAKSNGHTVSDRGRISATVREAYIAAQ